MYGRRWDKRCPALKKAHVGIAMGGIGSDITVDAADIVLVSDDISQLPHLLALSKKMMSTIKLNLSFSMGLNFIAILLAITGVLNPVVGALVHNVGSVLVIINSAFLLRWKKSNFNKRQRYQNLIPLPFVIIIITPFSYLYRMSCFVIDKSNRVRIDRITKCVIF